MGDCDTPANYNNHGLSEAISDSSAKRRLVLDKDDGPAGKSSSNTRSKFNAEGGEMSHGKDLSLSLSKYSDGSVARRLDFVGGTTSTQKKFKKRKQSAGS